MKRELDRPCPMQWIEKMEVGTRMTVPLPYKLCCRRDIGSQHLSSIF